MRLDELIAGPLEFCSPVAMGMNLFVDRHLNRSLPGHRLNPLTTIALLTPDRAAKPVLQASQVKEHTRLSQNENIAAADESLVS